MTVEFTLDGVEFVALNAGPQFKFTEAVSFVVMCDTQAEVDYYWEKLTADGSRSRNRTARAPDSPAHERFQWLGKRAVGSDLNF